MSFPLRWMARAGLFGMACAALAGCASLDGATGRLTRAVQPYRMDIVQGNVVTREQLAVLRPGMSRIQARDVLGTPLLASVFHANRWDYVFTLKRQGAEPQQRRVTVFFQGDAIERIEADELPSEADFAASLGAKAGGKVPVLEASEESLKAFPPPKPAAPESLPPLPASYPPLEPPSR